jgi:hypothetical protein
MTALASRVQPVCGEDSPITSRAAIPDCSRVSDEMLPRETTSMPTATATPICSQPLPRTIPDSSPTTTPTHTPASNRTARRPRTEAVSVRQTTAAIGAKIGAGWCRSTCASHHAAAAVAAARTMRHAPSRSRPAARAGQPAA